MTSFTHYSGRMVLRRLPTTLPLCPILLPAQTTYLHYTHHSTSGNRCSDVACTRKRYPQSKTLAQASILSIQLQNLAHKSVLDLGPDGICQRGTQAQIQLVKVTPAPVPALTPAVVLVLLAEEVHPNKHHLQKLITGMKPQAVDGSERPEVLSHL